ncbi:MAG: hypothetical protein LQ352_001111 [Teloschistes flavicans]|nr:MAG: hypothetical protein LQ352_001111 [Teloschistes flavicans]
MPKKHWMLSVSPARPDVVVPGRLVTDRKFPQNYFDSRGDPGLKRSDPLLTWTNFRDLAEVHMLFNENTFQANLTAFFSKHLKIGSDSIRSIEADKGERCQLVQADEWLYNICSARTTQTWLERTTQSLGKKVWMITDTLILSDTKIKSADQHKHSVGGEVSAPVMSLAGVPIPTPLDPSVGVATARDSRHERAMTVPDKMVFAVQYVQVKILKQRRGELSKDPGYGLASRATWTPLWEMRGETRKSRAHPDSESESDDEGDDEYVECEEQSEGQDEEVLKATFASDDVDEEEDSSEEDVSDTSNK